MARRNNSKEFTMNPEIQKFQYEVAQEIGIDLNKMSNTTGNATGTTNIGINTDALTKTDQGNSVTKATK